MYYIYISTSYNTDLTRFFCVIHYLWSFDLPNGHFWNENPFMAQKLSVLPFIESKFKKNRNGYEKEVCLNLCAWIIQKCLNSIVMILTYEILFQFSKSPFIWTIKLKLNNFLNKSGNILYPGLRLLMPVQKKALSCLHKNQKHHVR